jgi:hypothetical protein
MRILLALGLLLCPLNPNTSPQSDSDYTWQHKGTKCNDSFTFCWYGVEDASDAEVTAAGNRWTTQDRNEKPYEWITAIRCVHRLNICMLARNQKVLNGSATNIDLYQVEEWSNIQIRAIGENDFPAGQECEIDTLLMNRVEGSVLMLAAPGPAAATKRCRAIMKPKTVAYSLEIGPPKF